MKPTALWLSRIGFTVFFFFVLFFYALSYSYGIKLFGLKINYHYYLFAFSICWCLFIFLVGDGYKSNFKNGWMLCLYLFILYRAFVTLSSNEYAFNIISTALICLSVFYIDKASKKAFYIYLILLGYYIEVMLGYYQIYTYGPGLDAAHGSMINSGLYSCFVVSCYPLLYYAAYSGKPAVSSSWKRHIIFAINGLILVTLIFITRSRTSLICFSVISCVIVFYEFSEQIKTWFVAGKKIFVWLAVMAVPCLVFMAYYFYQVKKMSALGRLTIWNITLSHWKDSFFTGVGFGKFSYYYPLWQAEYFKGHPNYDDFFLTAADSTNAFNEYLQIFSELGVTGLIAFAIVIYLVFATKSVKHKQLLLVFKLVILSILITGLFSYPFQCNPILCIFFFSVFACFKMNEKQVRLYLFFDTVVWLRRALVLVIIAVSICLVKPAIDKAVSIYKWSLIRDNNDLDVTEAAGKYEELLAQLKDDPDFLVYYAQLLLQNNSDCFKAINLLNKAKVFASSVAVYNNLAIAHLYCNNYNEAIKSYTFLNNLIPSRFAYKVSMMRLYQKSGDHHQAKKMASIILNMPVKYNSNEVEVYKIEAKNYLEKK